MDEPRPARERYPFLSHRTCAETHVAFIHGEPFLFISEEARKALAGRGGR